MHVAKLCTNLCIEDFELKTIEFSITCRLPIGSRLFILPASGSIQEDSKLR